VEIGQGLEEKLIKNSFIGSEWKRLYIRTFLLRMTEVQSAKYRLKLIGMNLGGTYF
jgi:hypothetical protein